MQKYFVIGKSLPHTLSPQIHKEFGLEYGVVELATQKDFDDFLANKKFCGINVTIPYKQEIMPYLDQIDDVARAVGAVNTVVNCNGKLYGFNTDVGGMEYALLQEGVTLKNKCVLILGSGGTSKTAQYVATKAGAKSIDIVSRQGELNYTNCFDKIDTQVLINTTPVGLYPHCDGLPLDIKCGFSNLESVFDVIYNPLKTRLLLEAEECGKIAVDGLQMLVEQARLAHNIFAKYADKTDNENNVNNANSAKSTNNADNTDNVNSANNAKSTNSADSTENTNNENNVNSANNADNIDIIDIKETERVYKNLKFGLQNIVLVGMAGSGKTTVGKALAIALGRDFVDTDRLIEEETGKTIPQIFEENGEWAAGGFREIEAKIIARECSELGKVIATGGGAVVNPQNRFYIKSNGIVVFVNRDLEKLSRVGRPLSLDIATVKKLFEERKEIYKEISNFSVSNNGEINDTVSEIIAKLRKNCL